jgi:uncharacterized protein YbjT (DUF2867 family)
MPMNILVTGGTGFVGSAIVTQLHNAGHTVHILSRKKHAPHPIGVETHRGDILRSDSLANAFVGMEAVIHLAGIISEAGNQTYDNVHLRGTHNVIQAAKRAGARRFLHMSALGTRPNASSRYHQSKWAGEELVSGSGLDWTIFRPSIIYGPNDGFVNRFATLIRALPIVPIVGNGETKFQPVPVDDVAHAFAQSLTEPQAIGETFDLCGGETWTLNEIVDQIMWVMNLTRRTLHLPLRIARAQAAVLEFLFATIFHRPPPLNRDQIVMLQEDNVGNGQPAEALFGLKPGSFRQGIEAYLG